MKNLDVNGLGLVVVLLLILGAVNWGLIGIFDYNLIEVVFVHIPILGKVLYIFIGLAGLLLLSKLLKLIKH